MGISKSQFATDDTTKALRKEGGKFLKTLRARAGLTQRDLAELIGLRYYTFLSQLESGAGRVPPQLYAKLAEHLGVDEKEFVYTLLMFYDPYIYKSLRGPVTREIDWDALYRTKTVGADGNGDTTGNRRKK